MSETLSKLVKIETRDDTFISVFQQIDEALSAPAPLPLRKEVAQFMPLRDQVLVRPCAREDKSESELIWIPEVGQEPPMEGIVLAHGQGQFDLLGRFWPSELQKGDRVLYGRYAGNKIKIRGEECRLMREQEICGVVR